VFYTISTHEFFYILRLRSNNLHPSSISSLLLPSDNHKITNPQIIDHISQKIIFFYGRTNYRVIGSIAARLSWVASWGHLTPDILQSDSRSRSRPLSLTDATSHLTRPRASSLSGVRVYWLADLTDADNRGNDPVTKNPCVFFALKHTCVI